MASTQVEKLARLHSLKMWRVERSMSEKNNWVLVYTLVYVLVLCLLSSANTFQALHFFIYLSCKEYTIAPFPPQELFWFTRNFEKPRPVSTKIIRNKFQVINVPGNVTGKGAYVICRNGNDNTIKWQNLSSQTSISCKVNDIYIYFFF